MINFLRGCHPKWRPSSMILCLRNVLTTFRGPSPKTSSIAGRTYVLQLSLVPKHSPALTGGAFLFRLGETRTGVYLLTLGSHAATGLTNEQQLVHLCLNRSR